MTDTSAFASTENKGNKAADPFKDILSTVYKLGIDQGKGYASRPAFFDVLRQGAAEGSIVYVAPKRGKPVAGVTDESHVGKIAVRHAEGVTKGGGTSAKTTAKNKLNNVVLCFTDPNDQWQSEKTWQAVKELHEVAVTTNKNRAVADRVPLLDIADAMLMMAAKTVKGFNSKAGGRTTPLTEEEIKACVYKGKSAPKDLVDVVKGMVTRGTKVVSDDGDGASAKLVALLAAARAFIEEEEAEDDAEAEEAAQFGSIEALVAKGKIVVSKNGKSFRFA